LRVVLREELKAIRDEPRVERRHRRVKPDPLPCDLQLETEVVRMILQQRGGIREAITQVPRLRGPRRQRLRLCQLRRQIQRLPLQRDNDALQRVEQLSRAHRLVCPFRRRDVHGRTCFQ